MRLPADDTHFKNIIHYQHKQWSAGVAHTPNHGVAVDVGAHVGSFTARYADVFDTVIAIEPVNTEYLRENTQHLNNVEIHPVGLSNCNTTLYAHNPLPGNSGGWELHEQPNHMPVAVTTLDALKLSACDLIKIDCQGHETRVVQGAAQTVKNFRPTLQVELPTEELKQLLASWDYTLAVVVGKDLIYTHSSKSDTAQKAACG